MGETAEIEAQCSGRAPSQSSAQRARRLAGGRQGGGGGWVGGAAVKYYSALLEESGTGCPQESNYCKTAERKEVAPDFPDAIYVSPPSPSAGETLGIRVAAVQNRPGEPVEVKTCPPLLSVRSKKNKTL